MASNLPLLPSSPTRQDIDREQHFDSDRNDYTSSVPSDFSPLASPMYPMIPVIDMWVQHSTFNPLTMFDSPTYNYVPSGRKTTLPSLSSSPLLNGRRTYSSLGFNSPPTSSSPNTMPYGSDNEITLDDSASQVSRRRHRCRRCSSSPSTSICSITPSESASQLKKPVYRCHGKFTADVDRPLPLFSGVRRPTPTVPSSNSTHSVTSTDFYSAATSQTSSDASSRFQPVEASQASSTTSQSFYTAVSAQSDSSSTQSFHTAQSFSDSVPQSRSPVILALGMGIVNAAVLDNLSEMGLTIDGLVDSWLNEN